MTEADEAFATWFFLEYGYRPRSDEALAQPARSAWEAGRRFERERAIKLLAEVEEK